MAYAGGETYAAEPLLAGAGGGEGGQGEGYAQVGANLADGRALSVEFRQRGLRRMEHRKKLERIWRRKAKRGDQLWAETDYTNDDQFTSLRYTAVVSKKPIQFTPDGYRLQSFEKGYRIKCFTVITMYNEDEKELERTLRGVCLNLQHMVQVQGPDFWKKFCVCVVSDGRVKANKGTLEYAEAQGFFDQNLMDESVAKMEEGELKPTMHLFEYSSQLKEDENFEKRFPPLQIIFALKEANGGKLDSHLWFFNAFADQLNPKYCFLLDVGTQPRDRAIWKLYRSMETNSRIAGVCGEIACFKPNYANPVCAAQHFEYKVSHIMDKSLESSFGFISVLPGAFSGYRFEAIRERDGKGPLVDYFMSISTPMKELGAFKANMYLAEDRVLCFEIIARKDCNWLLHYVKNAVAETDIPMSLDILIKQRRRWLNGSFFASVYTLIHFNRFWKNSTHSLARKLAISSQFTYYVFNLVMNWLLPGFFYLAFFFLTSSTGSGPFTSVPAIATALNLMYIFLTMSQFIMGLGNTPDEMKQMYLFSCLFYGMFSYLIFVLSAVYVITTNTRIIGLDPIVIKVASIATTGCYFVAAGMHGELGAIASSFLQYIFMMPTFFNIFSIYSFCNIHDISWGTKGIDTNEGHGAKKGAEGKGKKGLQTSQSAVIDADQQQANQNHQELLALRQKREAAAKGRETKEVEKEFKSFRSSLLLCWLFSNALFVYVVASKLISSAAYLPFLFIVAAVFTGMRFIGSCYFLISRYCWLGYRKILKEKEQVKVRKQQAFLQKQHRNGAFVDDEIDDVHAADPTRQEAEFV